MQQNIGFVYLLSNPAMPGLIKIGVTYAEDVKTRMNQLYNTSVPFPFELVYVAKVQQPDKVESALHTAFAPQRVNTKREFFSIEPSQAISILKLLEISDATEQAIQQPTAVEIDSADIEAGKEYTRKRPRLNFSLMGIAIGSELVSTHNAETAIVKSDRTVDYKGEEMSLTQATRLVLGEGYAYNIAPGPYWTFNGRRLRDIYNETYLREE